MTTFLLFVLNSNLGLGIGTYPNGLLSVKIRATPEVVTQFTLGTSTWHYYSGHWKSVVTLGGRLAFQVGEGSNGFKYIHFLGIGAGIHSYNDEDDSKLVLVGEGFYEFELFPNPDELPLSIGLGAGIWAGIEWMEVAIFPSIHFYLK